MAAMNIKPADWDDFLNWVTRGLVGKRAEIEVLALNLGAQKQAAWLPLQGLAYDPKNDVIEIALDGLDHLIHKPRELVADEDARGVVSIEIIDAEGVRQIVKLKEPLPLPPPDKVRLH